MRIPLYYYIIAIFLMGILLYRTKKISVSIVIPYMFLIFAQTVLSRGYDPNVGIRLNPFWYFHKGSFRLNGDLYNQLKANVAMFIPVGFLLPFSLKKPAWAVLYAFSFSLIIEILQLIFHKGLCESNDVINNTLGAAIGFFIYCVMMKMMDVFRCLMRNIGKTNE